MYIENRTDGPINEEIEESNYFSVKIMILVSEL
jgi:hypothetical protein